MEHVADHVVHDIRSGSEMRPRRWYTDEITPQRRRNVKLSARNWRYRSFIRRKREDAAPMIGAAASFVSEVALAADGRAALAQAAQFQPHLSRRSIEPASSGRAAKRLGHRQSTIIGMSYSSIVSSMPRRPNSSCASGQPCRSTSAPAGLDMLNSASVSR
jgi:hypothetical protein